jgi:Zn-dependent peptidase ImmA (M78 family)/transcriptional regulator with XRE-family HTH domain
VAAVLAPVNPAVLAWAMAEAGWTVGSLADKLHVDGGTVQGWLRGEPQPTTTEFRKLAAALKRPSSFFFLPSPPSSSSAGLVSFRAAPNDRERGILPSEAQAIRQALRVQQFTAWSRSLLDERPPNLPAASDRDSPEQAAAEFGDAIGWSLANQLSASSAAVATRRLRSHLEVAGVVAMQFALGEGGCRGFSLNHDVAPLIAINSAYIYEARAFSYLHEAGHLVRRTQAICGGALDQGLERWCEEFAAAILLPKRPVMAFVDDLVGRGKPILTTEHVTKVARHFKASRLGPRVAIAVGGSVRPEADV